MQCSYCGKPVPAGARQCPHCFEDLAGGPAPPPRVKPTQLETPVPPPSVGPAVPPPIPGSAPGADSTPHAGRIMKRVEEAVDRSAKPPADRSFVAPGLQAPPASHAGQTAAANVVAFRPLLRPPMARLCILDDGESQGEWIRIRESRCQIGRTEGDVVIPHDDGISGRHAEIVRRLVRGQFEWLIRDLNSTNGTFVKISRARLKQDQELLIGGRRYRFEVPGQGAEAVPASDSDNETGRPQSTRKYQSLSPADVLQALPRLIELTPQGEGMTYPLSEPENWIGTAPQCNVVIGHDPLCSPRHAKVSQDDSDRWRIEDNKSLNGIWLRVDEKLLNHNALFQLGEQRFRLALASRGGDGE